MSERNELSFEERHTWAGLALGFAAVATYIVIITVRSQDTPISEVAWAWPMLWTVLIAGGAYGAVYGILAARHRGPRTDPREIEIDRFGELSGKGLLSFSVLVAIVLVALDVDGFWVAQTLFLGSYTASTIGTVAKLVAHRKGLPL
ncbi:MAG: hypothetical protein CVT64_08945 [Actinobacteria bacterium HGW-Actinobacteria-4]|nr:MAG: hypothetical protein CVT64_08945 [Actinobacteria bacterium HGW-Actinobacteria-4]